MGDQLQIPQIVSSFHSTQPSHIPVYAYYVYVSINSGLSDNQAIINLVLIERFVNMAQRNGATIIINSLTIHRLILASVLITSKFYNDIFFGNQHVAYIGGVNTNEINILEAEFLKTIEWRVWVDPSDYDYYQGGVQQHFQALEQTHASQRCQLIFQLLKFRMSTQRIFEFLTPLIYISYYIYVSFSNFSVLQQFRFSSQSLIVSIGYRFFSIMSMFIQKSPSLAIYVTKVYQLQQIFSPLTQITGILYYILGLGWLKYQSDTQQRSGIRIKICHDELISFQVKSYEFHFE
ncbi:cyclin 2 [Stylonychia lemnae]|uniref:Cyclin 2 n=1 Tax=Stylonychia lemnae TaxID=5949 RepID=A0A077ZRF0_STYLE|nr:cyclin 2 [Stylonychia lemnae]|eukprot:CDW72498.1 cyclin 2 [Stylonychia lemnae]